MASEVTICNQALTSVGGKMITSFADDSNEARLCNLHYADRRDEVFRAHPWNCISSRKSLGLLTTPPAFGFSRQYQLPADCLRVLTLNDVNIPWLLNGYAISDSLPVRFKIEGRLLLTDEITANIIYVSRVTDPNQYDSLLRGAISARIAAELAWPIARNSNLIRNMWELYRSKLQEARTTDGMEGTPDSFESDEIGSVRH